MSTHCTDYVSIHHRLWWCFSVDWQRGRESWKILWSLFQLLLHAASTPENFPFSTNLGRSFLISATASRLLGWQTSGVLRYGGREIDLSVEFWMDRPVLACHDDIITSLLNLNTWDFSKPCSTGEKEHLCEVPERMVDPGYSGWDGSLPPTPFEGLPRLGCSFGRPACLCSYTSDQLVREYCPL